MKKNLIIFSLIGTILLTLTSAAFKLSEINKTAATVEQNQNISIFSYSKPIAKYDIIGSVKVPTICSDKAGDRLEILIKRAKKEFPSAEGLIINGFFGVAEVIKFKE
jgi:hypothetical protein